MPLRLKAEHASETEDFESGPKIVKFAVVSKREEQDCSPKEELTSFEDAMLPHLNAAHNLAKWLLRNEADAQDVVQEAYLRAFNHSMDFMARTAVPGCSRLSETPPTPCSKGTVQLTSTLLLMKKYTRPATTL